MEVDGDDKTSTTKPGEGPAKKRKFSPSSTKNSESAGLNATDAELCFHIRDVSFSVPQRKKLRLELTKPVETGTSAKQYLRAKNQQTNEIEFGVPVDEIGWFLNLQHKKYTDGGVSTDLVLFCFGTAFRVYFLLACSREGAASIQLLRHSHRR